MIKNNKKIQNGENSRLIFFPSIRSSWFRRNSCVNIPMGTVLNQITLSKFQKNQ